MANSFNLGESLESIIDILPIDAQRLVNERLPHVEAMIDNDVEEFSRSMSASLQETVEAVIKDKKAAIDSEVREVDSTKEQLIALQSHYQQSTKPIQSIRRSLSDWESSGTRSYQSFVGTQMVGIRDTIRDYRADRLSGRIEPESLSFRSWYQKWKDAFGPPHGFEADEELSELTEFVQRLSLSPLPKSRDFPSTELVARSKEASLFALSLSKLVTDVGESAKNGRQYLLDNMRAALEGYNAEIDILYTSISGYTPIGETNISNIEQWASDVEKAMARLRAQFFSQPPYSLEVLSEELREYDQLIRSSNDLISEPHSGTSDNEQIQLLQSRINSVQSWCQASLSFVNRRAKTTKLTNILEDKTAELSRMLSKISTNARSQGTYLNSLSKLAATKGEIEQQIGRLERLVDRTEVRLTAKAILEDKRLDAERIRSIRLELDDLAAIGADLRECTNSALAMVGGCQRYLNSIEDLHSSLQRAIEDGVLSARYPHRDIQDS